jgi:predicted nucleic acid-binding protein
MNNDKIVVDANIAVKWAIIEEDSDKAEALLVEKQT